MNKTVLLVSISLLVVACSGESQQATQEAVSTSAVDSTPEPTPEPLAPSIKIAATTPEEAYEALKEIIETGDLEAYKSIMSSSLAQRLQGDFLINDALRSAKNEGWFDRVPMAGLTIEENMASFSKTVDEGTMMATYSIVFANEEGVWKLETFKTSTKAK